MTYLSLEWLGWMAGVTLLFWLAPPRFRPWVLIAAAAAFLAVYDAISLAILAVLTGATWFLTRGAKLSGRMAVCAIAPTAAVLIGFKIASAAAGDDLLTRTLIPLGLSYYALRCIHFAIERYKGQIGDLPPTALVAYLFFLPTIFVGPIHRYPAFERDQRRHRWDQHLFAEGLERIVYGYVKIAVLGNFLTWQIGGKWAARLAEDGTPLALYLEMVRISFNLYFQFSGFSDVAIGFARLLGFRVMENFRWPYLKKNINAFWQSWHISLTSWCREYVYTPVIAQTRVRSLGILATLIVIGLWHEISLRYLAWGCYHALGIIVWQHSQRLWAACPEIRSRPARWALDAGSVLLTVHFVWLGFLLVRQPDFVSMGRILETLFWGWM